MDQSKFICYNGIYIHADEPCLQADNRAFRFGDFVSEDFHAYSTEPQFLNWHFERLTNGMKLLAMEIPVHFTPDVFRSYISKLLMKNRFFGGAAVHLTVFRDSPDLFVPGHSNVSFVMDCRKLENNFYELNSKGLVIDVFREMTRFRHKFSSVKNADVFLFLSAGIFNRNNGLDECILLNEKDKIVESVHSNVFLVKGKSVFTPAIDEGCIPGIIRRAIIVICRASGFHVNDQCSLSSKALEEADEVFLTDVVNGIRWAGAYKQKRYYKKTTQLLIQKLNEYAFAK